MGQSIDLIVIMYLTIQRRAAMFAGLGMGSLVGASTDTGSRPAKPRSSKGSTTMQTGAPSAGDKYSTRTWEDAAVGKRVKVHSRVNVADLWDRPDLLQRAASGQE